MEGDEVKPSTMNLLSICGGWQFFTFKTATEQSANKMLVIPKRHTTN
jgi:hypothetical protein